MRVSLSSSFLCVLFCVCYLFFVCSFISSQVNPFFPSAGTYLLTVNTNGNTLVETIQFNNAIQSQTTLLQLGDKNITTLTVGETVYTITSTAGSASCSSAPLPPAPQNCVSQLLPIAACTLTGHQCRNSITICPNTNAVLSQFDLYQSGLLQYQTLVNTAGNVVSTYSFTDWIQQTPPASVFTVPEECNNQTKHAGMEGEHTHERLSAMHLEKIFQM